MNKTRKAKTLPKRRPKANAQAKTRVKAKAQKHRCANASADGPSSAVSPRFDSSSLSPVNIAQIREQITRLVGKCAQTMVERTIEDVEKGHYLGMKFLFEIAGIHPPVIAAESEAGDSLAAILLRNLGIPEGEPDVTETKVTRDSLSSPQERTTDTVE